MGRAQRQKGKRGERETAARFREIFGDGVRRGWQTRHGHDDPDICGVPFLVENKRHKKVNVRAAVAQALADKEKSGDKRPILVVAHEDQRKPLAVMLLDDFLELVRRAYPADLDL
jgi:hypothetical protein